MKKLVLPLILSVALISSCTDKPKVNESNPNLEKAITTLDSLYRHYDVGQTNLLSETYPFDDTHKTTYLASEDNSEKSNEYSYLWPYSGTFSAVAALLESTGDLQYKELLDEKTLPGLEKYFDTKREPAGYASYVNGAPESDRFYDDNVWLGIDYTDIYVKTQEARYLEKAKLIWTFVASGMDDKLGGAIYWCEQKKHSKNTCSNAPGSVFALKMFQATEDSVYFNHGKSLYEWTKANLQDSTDYLYYDNIDLEGKIGKAKYAYNSGQMIQAAALLHKITGDKQYLTDAQNIAASSYDYFFADFTTSEGETFKMLRKGNIWFTAVMMRGFVELYHIDGNAIYMDSFEKNLDYAWNNMRDTDGLFGTDWTGADKKDKKWLLTEAAMVEMYARVAGLKKDK